MELHNHVAINAIIIIIIIFFFGWFHFAFFQGVRSQSPVSNCLFRDDLNKVNSCFLYMMANM